MNKFCFSGVDVNETIGHGWTALMQACQIANAQLVQLLLTNGANPNISYGIYSIKIMKYFLEPQSHHSPICLSP